MTRAGETGAVYVVIWYFELREGREGDFLQAYGPHGLWADFFKHSPAYLGSELLKAMNEFGLSNVYLQEGAHSNQKSVEASLNISSFADRDLGKQAQLARKVFCDYIRQVEPEITATDDQIVTIDRWKSQDAYWEFLRHYEEEYTALDARCGTLTAVEEHVGSFETVE